jgi:hypothetical protein
MSLTPMQDNATFTIFQSILCKNEASNTILSCITSICILSKEAILKIWNINFCMPCIFNISSYYLVTF